MTQSVSSAEEQALQLGTLESESDGLDSILPSDAEDTEDIEDADDIELAELVLPALPPPLPLPPLPPLDPLARATLRVVNAGAA